MGRPRTFDEAEILRTATHVFGRNGFDALSIDTLLGELGLNRASFYKLYGSKHGLAHAALQQLIERAAAGDVDVDSKNFTIVALVELSDGNESFHGLLHEAVALCFDADPSQLGSHVLARANITTN